LRNIAKIFTPVTQAKASAYINWDYDTVSPGGGDFLVISKHLLSPLTGEGRVREHFPNSPQLPFREGKGDVFYF
jgi:hypothetical protein